MIAGVRHFLQHLRKCRSKTYRLHFSVMGRTVDAQIFKADNDEAALAFMDIRQRGRSGVLSGEAGVIRRDA